MSNDSALTSSAKEILLRKRLASQLNAARITELIQRRGTAEKTQCLLSFAQQRLWFLDQLEQGSAFYNIPAALRLRGVLQRDALQFALNTIVQRHEALRTTFSTHDGQPTQYIAPSMSLVIEEHDLSSLPEQEIEARADKLAGEEARRPFDLKQGPLIRCSLLQLSPDQHLLLLTLHHIIADGWSIGVFIRELGRLYARF
ncbi:MAG: hypothetical protein KZQ66_09240 [Candidatus Thiodiazotropha sp. (ex Lucinoma aequizonata)]|nr:hypothetical protein [Candidatus Thiodiazotropha sp. (ex Lucinoma aequizonata)]MCU7896050.1 hypothetical protein [Candidatus Thiodiazotropha sp. (ex Lucinoma aequizonata)]MCU7899893.1 hypothetical protein [Candidatus Thiodiazotropha sp. (ex Lucinoma aequizonata)]MCU7902154.1 hypothetical protein [Candidatus Thiodiazotropha sp. (ex Lucinoma aequizonata)]